LEGVGVSNRKRERVRFQQKKGRPVLSRDEAEYWLEFLPKVLKIGTEFEINLPSPDRALNVRDDLPCVSAHLPCVKDCANLETCLVERHPVMCLTRHTGKFLGEKFTCPAANEEDVKACQGCEAWALDCKGMKGCAMYTPFCTVCPSFQREGDVVEKGNIRQDAETIRREMRELLQPTEFVGDFGKMGILEVKKDNSLINNGGIEIPTVGRRVHWNSFYQMCSDIVLPIKERGGFVNERCGQHYHVLAGYFGGRRLGGRAVSELEKSIPEIVLANLHQLHRRYELAMFWIMSAGSKPESLTRWARFRQSLRRFSALHSSMSKIQSEMFETVAGMNSASSQKGKYASVAYHFCEFDSEGNASTFHIENRIGDGVLSPAAATAWAMLCYALVLKAVRLSQYGIMEDGSDAYRAQVKKIQPHLIDGERREWGEHRTADTSGILPFIPWLRENATEMVTWLKPELSSLGPAYDILMALADKPCSLRLCEGRSWDQIEEELYAPFRPGNHGQILNAEEIREVVDLGSIMDCDHLEVWIEEVAAYLGQNPQVVADAVHQLIQKGEFRWSDPVGALITA
jgi:hypothetical protein